MSINVVLVCPVIPQNTGAIGRTCLGLSASLHLVGPLGFSLDDKYVKRAGLDYWSQVDLNLYDDWTSFSNSEKIKDISSFTFLSRFAQKSILEQPFIPKEEDNKNIALVFGSEVKGLYSLIGEEEMMKMPNSSIVKIPTTSDIRSLNLATSVGIVAWEAWKEMNGFRK